MDAAHGCDRKQRGSTSRTVLRSLFEGARVEGVSNVLRAREYHKKWNMMNNSSLGSAEIAERGSKLRIMVVVCATCLISSGAYWCNDGRHTNKCRGMACLNVHSRAMASNAGLSVRYRWLLLISWSLGVKSRSRRSAMTAVHW